MRHRQGIQFERRGGDDAQRAFATNKQISQVVAGVVFTQTTQAVPDFAFSRDDLKAQCQLARVAVTQNLRATRVRRQIATDRAAAFSRQAKRKQSPRLTRRRLHRLQNTARLNRHGVIIGVDRAHTV